ncbi:MAG: hypothetical protein KJO69_01560 [Gammaproteobacteria bacterium]|nr:hypothetical protein [Gammaproteobacteria bacterium]
MIHELPNDVHAVRTKNRHVLIFPVYNYVSSDKSTIDLEVIDTSNGKYETLFTIPDCAVSLNYLLALLDHDEMSIETIKDYLKI